MQRMPSTRSRFAALTVYACASITISVLTGCGGGESPIAPPVASRGTISITTPAHVSQGEFLRFTVAIATGDSTV
jgi:hypothetical protein